MDSLSVSYDSSMDISFNDAFVNINDEETGTQIEAVERPSKPSPIDKAINIYLNHNTTLTCLEDIMDFYNEGREDCTKLPSKKKSILKLFRENYDMIRIVFIVTCEKCKKATKIDPESTEIAMCCEKPLSRDETNFFVYLPLEDQITKIVKRNWSHIQKFDTSSSNGESFSDAHDGDILRNVLEQYKDSETNILSMCLNVDGASKFKSNTLSLWPIQLSQNYLPPEIRFQPQNIIVNALYYGSVKVNCREFMLPLVEELNDLNMNAIKLTIDDDDYVFKPIITHCAADLPARSMLQEIKQFGGYYSCPYCKIPGEPVLIRKSQKKKTEQEWATNRREEFCSLR